MMETMATPRPTFIDLHPRSSSATESYKPTSPGERMQHVAGDVPPALSPLDAFAAHSRRLAKELEESKRAGQRRMSRLPPHIVTKSLTQHQANRPHYFRSLSGSSSPSGLGHVGQSHSPEVAEPKIRPLSEYPRISRIPNLSAEDDDEVFVTPSEALGTGGVHQTSNPPDYFGAPRAESPEPVDDLSKTHEPEMDAPRQMPTTDSLTGPGSPMSNPNVTVTLAPPNAPFARQTNHHRPGEVSDDDNTSSNAGSTFSHSRKLSSNSGMSMPHSPVISSVPPHARSPSMNSDKSIPGSRSHLNFSRPMSSTSLHNIRDTPSRQQSKGSQASHPSLHSFDLPRTPVSFDEARPRESEDGFVGTASSYTYGKYSLPRGRMADRESAVFLGLAAPHFEWKEPMFPSTPPLKATNDPGLDIPSPSPTRPSKDLYSPVRPGNTGFSFEFHSEKSHSREKARRPTTAHSASPGKTSTSPGERPSTSQGSSSRPLLLLPMPALPTEEPRPEQSLSSRSNSTVRPPTLRANSDYQALSADDHVTKAIELHQHGDLKESTYHLRVAAKQDHPTGMLLYALACRHGWGMRPNQQEGVSWLRKAMDSSMLEVASDENPAKENVTNVNEKKAHRAQFALSIYELGVSHLNGWGTEQDKPLALRCFEIAGDWGDVDALTEAGFCYAEGIGCKRDLRKAAKFYRLAAAKGVSMVGNSWIYKDKYNDVENEERSSRTANMMPLSPGKPRNKSRTRSIFSRKKSISTPR